MMKRIYINNGAWTQAVDFDPDADGDIIILTSPAGTIQDVIQDHVEANGLEPQDAIHVARIPAVVERATARDRAELRHLNTIDITPNGRFMRDLLGDDDYQAWLDAE